MHCMQHLHEDNNWVDCDGCEAWYHFECASLDACQEPRISSCLNCEDS